MKGRAIKTDPRYLLVNVIRSFLKYCYG